VTGTDAGLRSTPEIDPRACNALTATTAGLLVPAVALQALPSTAPGPVDPDGAHSINVEVVEVADQDCPDRWQVGARLSPFSDSVLMATGAINLLPVDGTYRNTGLFVDLPEAGRYALHWDVRGNLCCSTASTVQRWISARVFNVTAGAAVPGTERLVVQMQKSLGVGSANEQECLTSTAALSHLFTVPAGGAPIRLRLEGGLFGTDGSGSTQTAVIESDATGRTAVTAVKISD
jgi:hypothetical protein